jgi:hypothetical protein
MRQPPCNAIGCRDRVPHPALFCARHLAMLQTDIQRILGKTYRPEARRQSRIFTITLETAQREILFCQTNGYRMPRNREFEWDDATEGGATHEIRSQN